MVTKRRLARSAPDDRRESILAVAREAFVADGFAATSMSTVAARVGGSKATLYKYFPSKEALFEAVMERKCDEVLAAFRDPDLPVGDVRELLRAVGGRMLRAIYQPEAMALHRTIYAESLRFPAIARIFFALGPERVHRQLADRLAQLAHGGAIVCADPLLVAQQFMGMVKGEHHMRAVCGLAPPPDAARIDAVVDHAVALLVAGLAAAPGAKRGGAARPNPVPVEPAAC